MFLQLLEHGPGSCDDLHPLFILKHRLRGRHKQHHPVSHDRSGDTGKIIPHNFPHGLVILVGLYTGSDYIGQPAALIPVSEFQNQAETVMLPDSQQFLVAGAVRAVVLQHIVDKSALNHGNHDFQPLPYFKVVASLLSGFLHPLHGFHAYVQDYLFIGNGLGQIFHNTQVHSLLCIGEFIVGCDDNNHHLLIHLAYFLDGLDSAEPRHMDVHKCNIRVKALRHLHNTSAGLDTPYIAFTSKAGGNDLLKGLQHNSLIICQ